MIYYHVLRLRDSRKKERKEQIALEEEDLQQAEPELEQVQEQP